jgi:hypothetical protein
VTKHGGHIRRSDGSDELFKKETVFILGAGASVHYGYPTGEELIDEVVTKAERLRNLFEKGLAHDCDVPLKFMPHYENSAHSIHIRDRWRQRIKICLELEQRLTASNPLLIDHFLRLNRDLWDVGRMAIAWAILDREIHPDYGELPVRKRDWLRFVRHQLAIGYAEPSELADNRVTFITFNYDISLELLLLKGLTANTFFRMEDVNSFLTDGRIIHVYGRVRDPLQPALDLTVLENLGGPVKKEHANLLDELYELSKGIRVIDPDEKVTNEADLRAAYEAIQRAEVVFILGFGFDRDNMVRLGIEKPLPSDPYKRIFLTNYGDHQRVNKRIDATLCRKAGSGRFTRRASVFLAGDLYA